LRPPPPQAVGFCFYPPPNLLNPRPPTSSSRFPLFPPTPHFLLLSSSAPSPTSLLLTSSLYTLSPTSHFPTSLLRHVASYLFYQHKNNKHHNPTKPPKNPQKNNTAIQQNSFCLFRSRIWCWCNVRRREENGNREKKKTEHAICHIPETTSTFTAMPKRD